MYRNNAATVAKVEKCGSKQRQTGVFDMVRWHTAMAIVYPCQLSTSAYWHVLVISSNIQEDSGLR